MPQRQPFPESAALLARIDAALARGEAAAARLDAQQRNLRVAAREALGILDRLIDSGEEEKHG